MISSCSDWIVATMSRMPVTARCVDSREQGRIAVLLAAEAAEHLVGEIDDPTPAAVELAAPAHVLGGGGGGDVERARCRRTPVEQQRFVFVGFVEDADATDVAAFAGHAVQPAETQSVVRHIQSRHLFGQHADLGIAFHERGAVCLATSRRYRALTRARSASSRT